MRLAHAASRLVDKRLGCAQGCGSVGCPEQPLTVVARWLCLGKTPEMLAQIGINAAQEFRRALVVRARVALTQCHETDRITGSDACEHGESDTR